MTGLANFITSIIVISIITGTLKIRKILLITNVLAKMDIFTMMLKSAQNAIMHGLLFFTLAK